MGEITKKDVEHIAGLARIKLDEKEKEKMAGELGTILGYIDKLKEVNTEGIEPTRQNFVSQNLSGQVARITGLENVVREDEPLKKPLEDQAADAVKLVEMTPDSKDNFVKVPAVFQ